MLFSSLVFVLFFLPCVLVLYYLLSFSPKMQNFFLLLASLFFYAWGEPKYVFLMMGSVLFNYVCGIFVDTLKKKEKNAKPVLVVAVVGNLLVLFIFKYLNFVVDNLNIFLGAEKIHLPNIVLPIGISFFTFQALSYVIDVYRDDAKVEKNLFYVGLYIAFFPQLIAGPIVRYNSIADQIRNRKQTMRKFSSGCARFAMGFAKKILLANQFAVVADHVFTLSADSGAGITVPATLAWLGAAAYMLQLFFDFAAYSDMAIGLGLMFGFKFEENFNYPYISKSVSVFWRRWHISLSTWFREYVYIPLGGSRVENQDKMVRNVFVVWLLTGIWHGANWTFLVWGLWNFCFILMERFTGFEKLKIPGFVKHIYLLLVTLLGMTVFRADTLGDALQYFRNMFGLMGNGFFSDTALMFLKEYGIFFAAGILFSTPIARRCDKMITENRMPVSGRIINAAYPVVLLLLFSIGVIYLVRGGYNPFIYFNF